MHSRENPSEDYKKLLDEYIKLHTKGNKKIAPDVMFSGISIIYYLRDLQQIVRTESCKSILDYGCGKASLYCKDKYNILMIDINNNTLPKPLPEIWNLDYYALYDPAYEKYNTLPKGKYDGVICSDVIEHIDEKDSDWVLEEIFSFARKFVFLTIACYEALKKFDNGRNVHVNVKSIEFWQDKLNILHKKYPYLKIYTALDTVIQDKNDKDYGHFKTNPYIIERK